jgi:hypothetical protein
MKDSRVGEALLTLASQPKLLGNTTEANTIAQRSATTLSAALTREAREIAAR